jgi:hypothetical protein
MNHVTNVPVSTLTSHGARASNNAIEINCIIDVVGPHRINARAEAAC